MTNEIDRAIERCVHEWGKLGLLLDDDPRAAGIAARCLYGGEVLPRWWLQARSIECATQALSAALRAWDGAADEGGRPFPLVVVADRYMPPGSPKDPHGGHAAPIDGKDAPGKQLVGHLEDLQKRARTGPAFVEFVSSHSNLVRLHQSGEEDVPDLPWRPRALTGLDKLRESIVSAGTQEERLLWYGPCQGAPIVFDNEADSTARGFARSWEPTIRELARQLRAPDETNSVLFTGAGASVRSQPSAPGFPPTPELVERVLLACVERCGGDKAREAARDRRASRPQAAVTGCACHKPDESAGLFDRGLAEMLSDPSGGPWPGDCDRINLERLIPNEDSEPLAEAEKAFTRAYRSTSEFYDLGVPHHHALLADLPWTLVATTNSDRFHERGALVGVSCGARSRGQGEEPAVQFERARRATADRTLKELDKRQGMQLSARSRGILKPYGSLGEMRDLVIDPLREEDVRKRVKKDLLKAIGRRRSGSWLVVLGHSLVNEQVAWVADQVARPIGRVLWIDPNASKLLDSLSSRLWPQRIRKMKKKATVLPALAHEFAADLWREHQRLREAPVISLGQNDAAAAVPAEPMRQAEWDVFLCHNSSDKPRVRELARTLTAQGLRVFFDENLAPGEHLRKALDRGIAGAAAAAVVVGEHGLGPHQDLEVSALMNATAKGRLRLVPVLLPGASFDDLPAMLTPFITIDLGQDLADTKVLDRLVEELRRKA